jgi:hypothetical protein
MTRPTVAQIATALITPVLIFAAGYGLDSLTAPIRRAQYHDAVRRGVIKPFAANMAGNGLTTNYLKP